MDYYFVFQFHPIHLKINAKIRKESAFQQVFQA